MLIDFLVPKIKQWLAIIAIVLSIMGIITFSLFILEEAFQTVMFGTWPATDCQRWDIVMEGTELMAKITITMKIVNCSVGWVQPLAFISYRAYAKSADFYIKGMRAKILAHAPELLIGQRITFRGIPTSWNRLTHCHWVIHYGKIKVITTKEPESRSADLSGILRRTGNSLFLLEEGS